MSDSDISVRAVRTALRQLAAERVPADGPLIDLVLVTRMLERHGGPNSRAARQWALGQVLNESIEADLERLRRRSGAARSAHDGPASTPGAPPDLGTVQRAAAIGMLQSDFSHDDATLEAISAVYHLHLRPDLGLSTTRLAALVAGHHARTVQRRLALGLALVAERLAASETVAVAEDRQRRMLARLPSPAGGRLFGVDQVVARITVWLADPHGAPALVLSGPGGCGKSTIAAAAVRAAIEGETAIRVAWVRATDRTTDRATVRATASGHPARTLDRRVAEAPPAAWLDSTGASSTGASSSLPTAQVVEGPPDPSLRALRAACSIVGVRPGALVVVDGVDDTAEMARIGRRVAKRDVLPRLLITSRLCWGAVPSVETIAVPPLNPGTALAFLRHEGRRRGLPGVTAAPDTALAEVIEATNGHPGALIVAATELRAASVDQAAWRFRHGVGRPGVLFDQLWRGAWCSAPAQVRRVVESVAGIERLGVTADPRAVAAAAGITPSEAEAALCAALDLGLLAAADGPGAAFTTPPFLATWRARDRLGVVPGNMEDDEDEPAEPIRARRRPPAGGGGTVARGSAAL
ncbi:MAG: hypothetical protein ABI780_00625 [Ardenticatenales bacterium]